VPVGACRASSERGRRLHNTKRNASAARSSNTLEGLHQDFRFVAQQLSGVEATSRYTSASAKSKSPAWSAKSSNSHANGSPSWKATFLNSCTTSSDPDAVPPRHSRSMVKADSVARSGSRSHPPRPSPLLSQAHYCWKPLLSHRRQRNAGGAPVWPVQKCGEMGMSARTADLL
jgi:hypothetical protein